VGTTQEWMKVLEFGVIFVSANLLLDAINDREGVVKWPNLFATAISSVFAGMVGVFGWRVLHGVLALLCFGVLLLALATGFVIRRARKRAGIASKLG
jgi:hypothetical protein